jgi:hypothetical protein
MTPRPSRIYFYLIALTTLTMGCEGATQPSAIVIPGPAVPNPQPTVVPYVWDTRDELAIWVDNPVALGPLELVGDGSSAFIRVAQAEREWTLRGPDLTPSATGVLTLLLRYRWRPDPALSPVASRTLRATAYFQTTAPLQPYYYGQGAASAELIPQDDWTDIKLTPGQFTPPIDVSYCYLHAFGANRGVLDIDRIELVR